MKVCLGQINTTPGDFEKNLAAIRAGMAAASKTDAELLVFPELTVRDDARHIGKRFTDAGIATDVTNNDM